MPFVRPLQGRVLFVFLFFRGFHPRLFTFLRFAEEDIEPARLLVSFHSDVCCQSAFGGFRSRPVLFL